MLNPKILQDLQILNSESVDMVLVVILLLHDVIDYPVALRA